MLRCARYDRHRVSLRRWYEYLSEVVPFMERYDRDSSGISMQLSGLSAGKGQAFTRHRGLYARGHARESL